MPIKPEDLSQIKDLLKESGLSIGDEQFATIVGAASKVLDYIKDVNAQGEAEMGKEAWSDLKSEMEANILRLTTDFNDKLRTILDNSEANDKL